MTAGRRTAQQMRNRERILAAARSEFEQVGYREAKINSIAARAALTRGGIYSNFPSKRALGLTVAADALATVPVAAQPASARAYAIGSFAQAWLARLPTGSHGDGPTGEHLASDLYAEIREDRDLRDACGSLLQLDAVIVAHALEQLAPASPGERFVRAASALLTVLHAADSLSAAAPGFLDPFTTLASCVALAATDFDDHWTPPHPSIVPTPRVTDHGWAPPSDALDLISNAPVAWGSDGVVALLGLRQAAGIEQALRAAPDDQRVFLVLVTDDPAERNPLARFLLAEVLPALRSSLPDGTLSRLSVAIDHDGAIARAAGVRAVTDDTHIALRLSDHRITEQAEGPAACHAVSVRLRQSTPG